ncbi:RF11 [Retroperitoneal fibromatosis-associated herpesvirus]|uniref:RF11 n=1 Tax=Retroperitoneal fibromatosis-associated herpesvirus TaxID=111469 RepID=U5NM76_9GAMA|nr:RF11 [Retroperitoneal fibromatosis-associated herpesvirus]AGY30743.1 RF11 [Retroperitoneal fibromatosis-associated herpesvirus]
MRGTAGTRWNWTIYSLLCAHGKQSSDKDSVPHSLLPGHPAVRNRKARAQLLEGLVVFSRSCAKCAQREATVAALRDTNVDLTDDSCVGVDQGEAHRLFIRQALQDMLSPGLSSTSSVASDQEESTRHVPEDTLQAAAGSTGTSTEADEASRSYIRQAVQDTLGIVPQISPSPPPGPSEIGLMDDICDIIQPINQERVSTGGAGRDPSRFSWYGESMTPRRPADGKHKTALYLKTKRHIQCTGTRLVPLVAEVFYYGKLVQTMFDETGAVAISTPAKEAPADHVCQYMPPYKLVLPVTGACREHLDRRLAHTLAMLNQGVLAVGTDAGIFLKGLLACPAFFIGNASLRKVHRFRRLSTRHEVQEAFNMERYLACPAKNAPYTAIYLGKEFMRQEPMNSCPVIIRVYLAPVYHAQCARRASASSHC